eukprot:3342921-Alexandrium_andersonii.AAC.1
MARESQDQWDGMTTLSPDPLAGVNYLASNPARGGCGPSTPYRPNSPLNGRESANIGHPHDSDPHLGGAAQSAALPAHNASAWGPPTFAEFGPR